MATEKDEILAEKEADKLILELGMRKALVSSILICFEHLDKISKLEEDLKNQWIDINDYNNTPKNYQEVLLLLHSGDVIPATYCDDVAPIKPFTSPYWKRGMVITHWMPMPKKPIKSN